MLVTYFFELKLWSFGKKMSAGSFNKRKDDINISNTTSKLSVLAVMCINFLAQRVQLLRLFFFFCDAALPMSIMAGNY